MSARFVERAGTKRVVALGLVLIAAGMGMLSFIQRETSYSTIIGMYVVMAIGMAMTMGPATESVMGSLPPAKAGVGSAMNDTTRQVGGALGVAVIGSAVSTAYVSQIDDLVPRFGLGPEAGDAAAGSIGGALQVAGSMGDTGREFAIAAQDAFVSAMSVGMRVGVAVLLLAAVVVWRFLPARAVVRPGVVAVDTPPTPDGISPAGAAAVE
jgi:MFS-type transporter involved in bile tolerance (Atg22 family)